MYRVNLLPGDLIREQESDGVAGRRLILIVIGVLLLGGYLLFLGCFYGTEVKKRNLEKELAVLQTEAASVESVIAQRKAFEQAVQAWDEAIRKRKTWAGFLGDLNTHLPVDAWLTKVSVGSATGVSEGSKGMDQKAGSGMKTAQDSRRPGVLVPETVTIEGAASSLPSVGIFFNSLKNSFYFQELRLEECLLAKDGSFTFKITGKLGAS